MGTIRKLLPGVGVVAVGLIGFAVATVRDIRASDPAVQGAVVGALAAVMGGIVGSAVGVWGALAADERRWAHDDRVARQRVGIDAARQVRQELLAATKLFSHEVATDRFKKLPELQRKRRHDWIEPPSDEEVELHTERALDLATEIPEAPVRRFVRLAVRDLEQWDDAERWGAGRWWEFCPRVEAEVDEFFGAYIRAETLPATPVVTEVAETIKEYWTELRQAGPKPTDEDVTATPAAPAASDAVAKAKSARPSGR